MGTGHDDATLKRLRNTLDGLERKTQPFDRPGEIHERGVHWVTPKLVVEVGLTEWTGDVKLRHPRFLGLREDQDPESVVRERSS